MIHGNRPERPVMPAWTSAARTRCGTTSVRATAALGLRLGREAFVLHADGPVDVADPDTHPELVPREPDRLGRLEVRPGEVLLARTQERIGISSRLAGILDGTSDYARLGLSIVLSQQVSPGFGMSDGAVLTLEIVSHLPQPVFLRPGTRICNLMLLRCREVTRSYPDLPHNHSQSDWTAPSRLADVTADAPTASFEPVRDLREPRRRSRVRA